MKIGSNLKSWDIFLNETSAYMNDLMTDLKYMMNVKYNYSSE